MGIASVSNQSTIIDTILRARQQTGELQKQLATGQVADNYGDLGLDRSKVLSFSQEVAQLEGYIRSSNTANLRINIATEAVTHFREITNEIRANSLYRDFTLDQEGQTLFQNKASAQFYEMASLLNTKADGRYIFSGRTVEQKPVTAPDEILNGANGKAGFKQIVLERALADLGADERGRLSLSQPSASEVQLSEDGVHSFGFKITAVNNGLSGITPTGPAGSPASLNLDVTANSVQEGETIAISLDLPDGTSRDLTLKATSSGPLLQGEFLIGATVNDTATNLHAALNTEVLRLADTELRSASLNEAADNFFDFDPSNPPQRVDGPPFETATALRDATPTDTVLWYQGELTADSARDSQQVLVDDHTLVSCGLRANEEAISKAMKNLAMASVTTYDPADANARDRYSALTARVAENLAHKDGEQNADHILIDLATAQSVAGRSIERHQAQSDLFTSLVEDVVNIDIYEVSAKLLDQQTRLQASYQTTSILSQLSLVNYL